MFLLPESKGCQLPKSLIDGETIGLFGQQKEQCAAKYPRVQKCSLSGSKIKQFERENDNINFNEVELKKRSVSVDEDGHPKVYL